MQHDLLYIFYSAQTHRQDWFYTLHCRRGHSMTIIRNGVSLSYSPFPFMGMFEFDKDIIPPIQSPSRGNAKAIFASYLASIFSIIYPSVFFFIAFYYWHLLSLGTLQFPGYRPCPDTIRYQKESYWKCQTFLCFPLKNDVRSCHYDRLQVVRRYCTIILINSIFVSNYLK